MSGTYRVSRALGDCDPPHLKPVTRHSGSGGVLGVVECSTALPFDVRRVYFHSNVPVGASRGAHGHLNLQQFLVAIAGEIDVEVIGAAGMDHFSLTDTGPGLYLPKGVWRTLTFATPDAVSLVLASEPYDADDYVSLEQLQAVWGVT